MHVAIIMDGNGRWAQNQQKPRAYGHFFGCKKLLEIIDHSSQHHPEITHFSFFCFSTENIYRSESEVTSLLKIAWEYLKNYDFALANKKGIKFNLVSHQEKFLTSFYPEFKVKYLKNKILVNKIKNYLENISKKQTKIFKIQPVKLNVNLLFNYSGQSDILHSVQQIMEQKLKPPITLQTFRDNLITKDIPDIDLLIRTSGEQRISNFMLWQLSYSELIFTDQFWPGYQLGKFDTHIKTFKTRQRRFGK